jgi:hypothetical protein
VDGIEIHWPSGAVQKIAGPVQGDRYYTVEEGKGVK